MAVITTRLIKKIRTHKVSRVVENDRVVIKSDLPINSDAIVKEINQTYFFMTKNRIKFP